MLSLFGIVELEGVIVAGGDEQFATIVKVKRCHRSVGSGEFEKLNSFQLKAPAEWHDWKALTFTGLNVPITSDVFCVG